MRLGMIGILLVTALFATLASATQPVATQPALPTCDMRYPALRSMRMEALLEVLRNGSFDEDQCAVDQLPRYGARAIPALEAMLQSKREDTRELAVDGLSSLGNLALPSLPKLESALDDSSVRVRWLVLQSFITLKPRSPALSADLLRRLAKSQHGAFEDDYMLVTIANLGELPPDALQPLIEALAAIPDHDQIAIDAAIDAISHVESPQAVAALTGLVGRGDTERSVRAASAVGSLGARALPDLVSRYVLAGSDAERDSVLLVLRDAWHVAATPGLAEYDRTDWVQLLRQLASADPVERSGALDTLEHVAPAFSAFSRGTFLGMRPPNGLCDALLALDAGTYPAADAAERQRATHISAELRATQPYPITCLIPTY